MKSSSVLSAACAALSITLLASCDGLKEAMTAHVDTVARAGTQELSVDRLATLINQVKAPPQKEIASALADAWVDYQLLGQSAAAGDTALDSTAIDNALWASIAGIKARKYYDAVSKTWGGNDAALAQQMYANGDVLAASHILFLTKGKSAAEKAAAKKKAESLRGQITTANFAAMAKQYSQDTQSGQHGGSLGVFGKGMMVPQFEQALLALKPGEISPVIETEYGYHIILRPTFDEVKADVSRAAQGRSTQVAESTFVTNLQKNGHLDVHKDAVAAAREVISNPQAHVDDGTTLATSVAGKFTAGRLAKWMENLPPQAQMQQKMQLQNAPDSMITQLVKNFATNELVLHSADSAKVAASPEELTQLRSSFIQARDRAWMQLGVAPALLADSAKTITERERLASARVDNYLDELATGKAAFAPVPPPLAQLMREKAKVSINSAGIERAVEKATKLRAAEDSVRKATQPSSVVPMPGVDAPPAAPATGKTDTTHKQ